MCSGSDLKRQKIFRFNLLTFVLWFFQIFFFQKMSIQILGFIVILFELLATCFHEKRILNFHEFLKPMKMNDTLPQK